MLSIWSIELLDIAIIGNESIHRNKMCKWNTIKWLTIVQLNLQYFSVNIVDT